MTRSEEVLAYWFGSVEKTILPSPHRTEVWFGRNEKIDEEIQQKFAEDLQKAVAGEYKDWEKTAHGTLALIIIFDQFSRAIYRDTHEAYIQDERAFNLCMTGIEKEFDHELSLIERVFFYFPMVHSENLDTQIMSVRAYTMLAELALPETKGVFESFLKFSLQHCDIIRRFGHFPDRNQALGRKMTKEEEEFLKSTREPS